MLTSFQEYWEKLKPELDKAFTRQLTLLLGDTITHDLLSLRPTLESGKKIRGCLVCMVNTILGGAPEFAMTRATAVELIQTATLIHDDFVDQDTVRRNRPATWTLQGARRAVLIGDVIFAAAIKMMNDLSREDGQVVLQTITQVARGAFHEPLNASKMLSEMASNRWDREFYEKVIHLKTGTLFGAACQLGSIAAGANPTVQEEFYRYGSRIGEAYQIADDLQEVKDAVSVTCIPPDQMVVLSPVFLYFVGEMRPLVVKGLEGPGLNVDARMQDFLRRAVRLMEDEIDRRLKIAVSEIKASIPPNPYADLIRKAPWGLVDMMMNA
jgi:geranylgeranyl pyrophosphate synthase